MRLRFTNINQQRKLWFPQIYNSEFSKLLVKCIRHMFFRYFFDFIIVLNAIFIAFNLDGGEPFFLALFTLEITLKLYAFGLKAFVRKLWNLFDTIVVASALIVTIIEVKIDFAYFCILPKYFKFVLFALDQTWELG